MMMKRCEDPHRRRQHAGQRLPAMPPGRLAGNAGTAPGRGVHDLTRPGAISGAVLRGARLSANLDEASLASTLGVNENNVRAWEQGSAPLASVPFPDIERLKGVLADADAVPRLIADIEVAVWCDLVIAAIAGGEDTSCLMADPIAREATFSELLAWSLAGVIPARYRPYAAPGPLLAGPS